MPQFSSSTPHAAIQQFHYNINVASAGSSAAHHGVGNDLNVHQGGQSMPQVMSVPPQQQLSMQQQHIQQQQQQHPMHSLPQDMQQTYSHQQSQQHLFQQQQQQQQQQQTHPQMHLAQQQSAPYLSQSTPSSSLNQGHN
jgi:hypothetical protein